MEYIEILNKIIENGIRAVKSDYKEGTDKYNGSIAGFEACKNKTPEELSKLLIESSTKTKAAFIRVNKNIDEGYWFIRCFELEVEWVCNVISAVLQANNFSIIINPTCRGILAAADIIGVAKK